jgi:hypothetical protein
LLPFLRRRRRIGRNVLLPVLRWDWWIGRQILLAVGRLLPVLRIGRIGVDGELAETIRG